MIDLAHEYKKRPRAFIGAGIIALSFLAAVAISHAANRSVEVWALKNPEPAGVTLEPGMVKRVKVYLPESLALYLPASQDISHRLLATGAGAGELIPRQNLSTQGVGATRRQVPIKVNKVDLPIDLQANDLVDLYLLPTKDSGSAGSAAMIARAIRVISVDNRARDLGGDVGLLCDMDEKVIADFLSAYGAGRIVVVRHGR